VKTGLSVLIREARGVDGALRFAETDVLAKDHRHVEHAARSRGGIQRPIGTFDRAREGLRRKTVDQPLMVDVTAANLRGLADEGSVVRTDVGNLLQQVLTRYSTLQIRAIKQKSRPSPAS
jgi:hypothetical protein